MKKIACALFLVLITLAFVGCSGDRKVPNAYIEDYLKGYYGENGYGEVKIKHDPIVDMHIDNVEIEVTTSDNEYGKVIQVIKLRYSYTKSEDLWNVTSSNRANYILEFNKNAFCTSWSGNAVSDYDGVIKYPDTEIAYEIIIHDVDFENETVSCAWKLGENSNAAEGKLTKQTTYYEFNISPYTVNYGTNGSETREQYEAKIIFSSKGVTVVYYGKQE